MSQFVIRLTNSYWGSGHNTPDWEAASHSCTLSEAREQLRYLRSTDKPLHIEEYISRSSRPIMHSLSPLPAKTIAEREAIIKVLLGTDPESLLIWDEDNYVTGFNETKLRALLKAD